MYFEKASINVSQVRLRAVFSHILTRKEGRPHRSDIGLAFSISKRKRFLGADDKKNIPDAGKEDEYLELRKVETVKADSPVQNQPAPTTLEAPLAERGQGGSTHCGRTADFGR